MALPTGTISMGQIRSAYGVLGSGRLSNDYGVRVLGKPANSQTSMGEFRGLQGVEVPNPGDFDVFVFTQPDPFNRVEATVFITLQTNFTIVGGQTFSANEVSSWAGPGTLSHTYYANFDTTTLLTNGVGTTFGTFDAWLPLNTTRSWQGYVNGSAYGEVFVGGSLKIASDSNGSDEIFSMPVELSINDLA